MGRLPRRHLGVAARGGSYGGSQGRRPQWRLDGTQVWQVGVARRLNAWQSACEWRRLEGGCIRSRHRCVRLRPEPEALSTATADWKGIPSPTR